MLVHSPSRLGLSVLTLALLTATMPAVAARHALLIGVSDYSGTGLNDLPGARRDIEQMQIVLQQRLGYQPDDIRVLIDAEATHTAIEQAFTELATQVRPGDSVYIHYSGHGSQVTDQNGDELDGLDETLVSWGARNPTSEGLDQFDILDDELYRWLKPIATTAGELVVVADSCHAATHTRGENAPVTRAGPFASQLEHPRAKDSEIVTAEDIGSAVRIGSADVDQSAIEMPLDDGKPNGLFTWHWASALGNAKSEETWRRVFDLAAMRVALSQGAAQRPQIAGANADRVLLGGALDPRPAILVTEVRGATVTLNAGRLSGITVGSLYAAGEDEDAAHVRIRETYDSWSQGEIEQGELKAGAFLSERERAFETAPLRLFALPPQAPEDQPLMAPLRTRLDALPGYVWSDAQDQADLVLAIVRPERHQGVLQYAVGAQGRETLPRLDPEALPELWVLTPSEQIISERLITPLDAPDTDIERLAENLDLYRRQIELRRLSAETGAEELIGLELIVFEPCTQGQPDCQRIRGAWRRETIQPLAQLSERAWPQGTLLSFVVENRDITPRYVYIFKLSPDGAIHAIFPNPAIHEPSVARLNRDQRLPLTHHSARAGMTLDVVGQPSLLALTTQQPIDPRLLEQPPYTVRKAGEFVLDEALRATLNPLEKLLATAIDGSNTRAAATWGTGSWGGALIDYQVQANAEEVKTPTP